MDPVTVAIVGGDRGSTYAAWVLQNPELARVVAVADPLLERTDAVAELHGLDEQQVFADWRHLVAAPEVADAVIICTRDHDHVEPAVAFPEAGYDVFVGEADGHDAGGMSAGRRCGTKEGSGLRPLPCAPVHDLHSADQVTAAVHR